jgi:hypothetical protein
MQYSNTKKDSSSAKFGEPKTNQTKLEGVKASMKHGGTPQFCTNQTAVTGELLKSCQSWASQIDNSLIGSSSFMSVALLPCSS